MNTASQLKALADQHHYGTLQMDSLLAITERIGRCATVQAQKGKYELTFGCDDLIGFNEYIPANRSNIAIIEKELHKHGYDTKVYARADQYGYLLNVRWGQPPTDVRTHHPAIYGSNRPF